MVTHRKPHVSIRAHPPTLCAATLITPASIMHDRTIIFKFLSKGNMFCAPWTIKHGFTRCRHLINI